MYDKRFLQQLMENKMRTLYARIISLNFDEQPMEQIEGRVTSGSVNIDGNSAVRRTCSLSLISETPLTDYFWTLNTKFKLAIGVENNIDSKYPNIIWFEQGMYLITSFSSNLSANAYTVSISGKDKMCLLNGEVGGQFPFSVDFGVLEQGVGKDEQGNEIYTKIRYHIKDIIREAVHTYGNEPFHNIIINDVEEHGLELEEYRYDTPLYIWREKTDSNYQQGTLYPATAQVMWNGRSYTLDKLESLGFQFDPLVEIQAQIGDTVTFPESEKPDAQCYIAKIDYGEIAGFKEIDLVYPDDLIMQPGENVTGLLDKIKKFLGEYEYFYNLDGQFVFQAKKIYLNTPWNPINNEGEIDFSLQKDDQYSYVFNSTDKFTSISHTPNITNLKNDFVVWGKNRNDSPIHMRYSIHKKPFIYTSIAVADEELINYNKKYNLNISGQVSKTYILDYTRIGDKVYRFSNNNLDFKCNTTTELNGTDLQISFRGDYVYRLNGDEMIIDLEDEIAVSDWREIIYQMSQDYKKYNHLDDFEVKVIEANQHNKEKYFPDVDNNISLYCDYFTGKTGYEQYYIDMDGFWREIYNPNNGPDYDDFVAPRNDEIQKIIDSTEDKDKERVYTLINEVENYNKDGIIYYTFDENLKTFVPDKFYGWTRDLIDSPENLFFWIDFLDLQGELEKFSVPSIGMRTKTVNDDKVKAIYYQEIPEIMFYDADMQDEILPEQKSAYRYFQVPNFAEMFSKSTSRKTAKEEIDNLLYNHAYCAESISLTSVPIYYLEPNTRIFVNANNESITGDYIVNRITIPLQYNGTMNISANKAPKTLY